MCSWLQRQWRLTRVVVESPRYGDGGMCVIECVQRGEIFALPLGIHALFSGSGNKLLVRHALRGHFGEDLAAVERRFSRSSFAAAGEKLNELSV